MALTVNSALIAAQAQTYAAQSGAAKPRAFTPPPVEELVARAGDTAVRVEISAEAADADRSRRDGRKPGEARDFAREAPLRAAQENAGTRPARPGTTLDIRI